MMNLKRLYIVFFIIILTGLNSYAQKQTIMGYRIVGDEVIFRFDKRDYDEITDEKNQRRMDFDDFDIENVVVSGQFNLWSRDAWEMEKIDDNIYELRKKLADFEDNFEWQFKFVINNNFWAEPSDEIANIIPATEDTGKPLYTYNLKFISAYPSKQGNAPFFLKGYENAKTVVVAGSFNKWDEQLFEMIKVDGGWELTLQLAPEIYQYKFIVDGEWMIDPANPSRVRNEFHGYNSLIEIRKEVAFTLFDYPNATDVFLAGDFNDWSEDECKMYKTEQGWKQVLLLTGGKYHYKFIVDGKWIVDPFNSVKEYDGHGNINSVKMVR